MCSRNVVNMSNLKGIYRTDCAGEPNLKVIKSKIVSLVYFEKGVATAVTALKSLNVFESVFVTQGVGDAGVNLCCMTQPSSLVCLRSQT